MPSQRINMHPRRSRAAFTLIELMVSIGIIGVLISIILPTLSGARLAASRVQAMANARTTGQTFEQYANQFGAYPCLKPGEAGPGVENPPMGGDVVAVRWWPEGVVVGVGPHWLQSGLWPALVAPIAPWPEHYSTWLSPGRDTELPGLPFEDPNAPSPEQLISYRYSNSFLGKPSLWREGAEPGAHQLGASRQSDVSFPSNKAILWDGEVAYVRQAPRVVGGHFAIPTAVLFVDGHVDMHDPTTATPAAPNPMKDPELIMTLHDTPEGVLGRDF